MWIKLSNWFYQVSSSWLAASALLIFLLFVALVLPRQASLGSAQGGDAEIPDLAFYYSATDLYRMAADLGPQGRADYIQARFTFDLVWPLVYTFFLVTTTSQVSRRAFPADSPLRRINLLPVLGMLGDYLENISTSIVMWRFPEEAPLAAWSAGVFTALKWSLIGASCLALLSGIFILLWRLVSSRRKGGKLRNA